MKSPRVYFAWLDKATGRFGTFSFALLDQEGWLTHPAQAQVLYKRINSWRNRSSAAGEFALATGLGPPDVGSVTSVSPKEINKFSRWISMSVLIVALGWGLATVLALPHAWYICLTALAVRVYEAIPYWRYRVRAYVSDPVVAAPLNAAPPPAPPPAEPVLVS
jgi:hypothetical protein